VKLSTFVSKSATSHNSATRLPTTEQQCELMLCLNQQEALMLFGLLQAALRHEPSRRTMLSSGDYKQFHHSLSQALAKGLASREETVS